jgi:hypothetical protein
MVASCDLRERLLIFQRMAIGESPCGAYASIGSGEGRVAGSMTASP